MWSVRCDLEHQQTWSTYSLACLVKAASCGLLMTTEFTEAAFFGSVVPPRHSKYWIGRLFLRRLLFGLWLSKG